MKMIRAFALILIKIILFEELAFGHWGGFGNAAVVAFTATAFSGEHGLGAFLVLLKLHVFLDGEGVGDGLDIEGIGTLDFLYLPF